MRRELKGTVVLKEEIVSDKFGVVFPEEIRMKCFQEGNGHIFCEHPSKKNIWTLVDEKKIRNLKWD